MTDLRIARIHGWEALDSRGRPTVACRVELRGGGSGRAVVPAGASTGGHEARERRDGGARYRGYGVQSAVDAVNTVYGPLLAGRSAEDRAAIDATMEVEDGRPDLGRLGANAALAVSLAVTLAGADGRGEPLWRVLDPAGGPPLLPMPMVNIVSGGAHAGRAVDIQDVLAVPVGAASFRQALEWASAVRHQAAVLLEQAGGWSALVADEGGLAARLDSNDAALSLVARAIDAAGFRPYDDVGIAIDVAANQLMDGDEIVLAGQRERLDPAAWIERVTGWTRQYPIISIEDVLAEDDWAGWCAATSRLAGIQVIGDDLFATDLDRLTRGIDQGAANAVLVKVNQAGTVSRAERVLGYAQRAGIATVVSARSGDSEDSWLADFAVGWRAGQIKVGSTMRSERTAKWNRLLEIESEGATRFAGRSALRAARL